MKFCKTNLFHFYFFRINCVKHLSLNLTVSVLFVGLRWLNATFGNKHLIQSWHLAGTQMSIAMFPNISTSTNDIHITWPLVVKSMLLSLFCCLIFTCLRVDYTKKNIFLVSIRTFSGMKVIHEERKYQWDISHARKEYSWNNKNYKR